jgi:hypothetical protein
MLRIPATVVAALIVSVSVVTLPASAQEANPCTKPTPPTLTVDGATATQQEIEAAVRDFHTFSKSSNEFLQCLDEYERKLGKRKTPEQESSIIAQYNEAVDEQKAAGDALNAQINSYNAVNPPAKNGQAKKTE